jgi:hypothetical protein
MIEFKPEFPRVVERMKRLWDLDEPLDRVPAVVSIPPPQEADGRGDLDGRFFGRLEEYIAWQERVFRARAAVTDDMLPVVHPQYGHALIGGLCGSPIEARSGTVWSHPVIDDLDRVGDLRLDWENELGRMYRADCERLLEWARGRCLVAHYEIEGVADTMASLRGASAFCMDLVESPEAFRKFAERVTDILIEFGRWNHEHVCARQGPAAGTGTAWSLWMPAGAMTFAEDASVLLSAAQYRENIQAHDRRLSAAFTRTLLEVHGEGNRHISAFGEIDGVSGMAIQDPLDMQPADREAVRRLLGKKVFYIWTKRRRIGELLAFTGTRGILLGLNADTPEEAVEILDELRRYGGG